MSEPILSPAEIILKFPGSVHVIEDSDSGRVIAEKVREIYGEQVKE